jgi:hypothetical protein
MRVMVATPAKRAAKAARSGSRQAKAAANGTPGAKAAGDLAHAQPAANGAGRAVRGKGAKRRRATARAH